MCRDKRFLEETRYYPHFNHFKMAASCLSKLQKFQGSLVGAVLGDCIGAVYEGSWSDSIELNSIIDLVTSIEKGKKQQQQYQCFLNEAVNNLFIFLLLIISYIYCFLHMTRPQRSSF